MECETGKNGAPHREDKIHIHSECIPSGAAQSKQSQAYDRLLVHVALPVLCCPPWEAHVARRVLTRDTRLARAERLGDSGWDEKHKHTRSDSVAAAVAVSTVVVVLRQLIRGLSLFLSITKSPAKEARKTRLERYLAAAARKVELRRSAQGR